LSRVKFGIRARVLIVLTIKRSTMFMLNPRSGLIKKNCSLLKKTPIVLITKKNCSSSTIVIGFSSNGTPTISGASASHSGRPTTTTRKLINTNGNTEGIFSSVNFRGILPMEIFPRYIPMELPWDQNLKQSKKKKMTCHFYRRNYSLENTYGKFRR